MKCRYCGSENPHGEERCGKCQRRLAISLPPLNLPPAIETATAPQLAATPQEVRRPAPAPVIVPPQPTSQPGSASQRALFANGADLRVVTPGQEHTSAPQQQKTDQRRPSRTAGPALRADQGQFEFAPPSRPLTREIDRRKEVPVADRGTRIKAALVDVAILATCAGLFAAGFRFVTGELPMDPKLGLWYAGTAALLAFLYKGIWCLLGMETPGLEWMGLRVVSFNGHAPNGAQRAARLVSGWLGTAAATVGLLWSLYDQETLSWHDHVSQTFLTYRS